MPSRFVRVLQDYEGGPIVPDVPAEAFVLGLCYFIRAIQHLSKQLNSWI